METRGILKGIHVENDRKDPGSAGTLTPEFIRKYIKSDAKKVRHKHFREFRDHAESVQIGNAIIVHGYRENIGARHFKDLSDYFIDAQFNVVAFDLPRFGRSPAERPELRGQIVSFAELVRALKSMLFAVLDSEQKSKVPTILVGYSNGALDILRMLQIYLYLQRYIAGIVLIATPLNVEGNARKELLRWKSVIKPLFGLFAKIRPHFAVNQYEPDEFSKDDPHHFKGAMEALTANQILVASEKARAAIKKITVPVLFVHGADDKTAPLDAVEWAFGQIGTPREDREKIVYPEIGHLVLQKHRQAMEDIVKWSKIRVKLAPPPPKIHNDPDPQNRIRQLVKIFTTAGMDILVWLYGVVGDFLRHLKFWDSKK